MDMKEDQDAYDLVGEYVRLQNERRWLQDEIDERNSRIGDLFDDLRRIARAVNPLLGERVYSVTHGHKSFAVRRGPNANRLDCVELSQAGRLIGVKPKPTPEPDAQPIAADAVADSPNDDLDNDAALASFAQWRGQQ